MNSLAGALLVRDLRKALLELYNPAELARSPLIELLGLAQQPDPPSALRCLLLQAIEALRPGDDVPPQAQACLTFDILLHRYVQQIPQAEVASSLGFGKRQLQRHEATALQVLAHYLWTYHGLQAFAVSREARSPEKSAHLRQGSHQELEWVSKSFSSEAASIADLLQGVVQSLAPLLAAARVRIETALPNDLVRLAIHTITMRQALVSILSTAVQRIPGGRIEVSAVEQPARMVVRIVARRGRSSPRPLGHEGGESMEMARELVAVSGGRLELALDAEAGVALIATLHLPIAQKLGVLVIDDNVDTLQLFQRYLQGTRYGFVGERDPQHALALAQELTPKVIILDVMLPGIDGWEMLGRLREHPVTHGLPVIVCTILPCERLALTLGASAFMRKPVSRGTLLAALDAQVDRYSSVGQ
ncbi:MAG: response regulator [Chloroflexi bacterium]|jgi:CheY-like chemotaxis protein|nr:response regulator [Chloroflexota bacterium]